MDNKLFIEAAKEIVPQQPSHNWYYKDTDLIATTDNIRQGYVLRTSNLIVEVENVSGDEVTMAVVSMISYRNDALRKFDVGRIFTVSSFDFNNQEFQILGTQYE